LTRFNTWSWQGSIHGHDKSTQKLEIEPSEGMHTSSWEAEAGGLGVQGQIALNGKPGSHNEIPN
jgi:hypothetical protein